MRPRRIGNPLTFPLIACLTACTVDDRVRYDAQGYVTGDDPTFVDAPFETTASVNLAHAPHVVELLRLAMTRSPAIAAARARAEAAAEGPTIAGWLPNPEVSFGWYETSVQTRVGPQEWSIGIRQSIPFPTKLATRSTIEEREANQMEVAYERVARDVMVDLLNAAYELRYLDDARSISAEIEPLLDRYVAAAASPASDSLVSELFRAETQKAQLENDRVLLLELRHVEAQRIRSLIGLPYSQTIGTPIVPSPPKVDATFEELLTIAGRHNQELREANLALEAARLRTSLATQSRLPDLSLGLTHIETGEVPSALGDPQKNGDDPLILQVGLSVPLWAPRDSASIRAAMAEERAAASDRESHLQQARQRVAEAWFRVGSAERLQQLYADVLVPRAIEAARTAEDLLAAGKGSVGGTLETIAVMHNFRLAEARARADLGRAFAELERAMGRPFDKIDGDLR